MWVQARWRLKPMLTTGRPGSEAPSRRAGREWSGASGRNASRRSRGSAGWPGACPCRPPNVRCQRQWRCCRAQAEALAPLLGDLERLLAAQGDLLRAGRRGGHQRVGELADLAFDQQAPGQAQQVIGRDGPQPGLAKATGGLAVGLAEEAVETGGVAFEQLAHRGRLRLPEGLQRLGLVEPGVKDVGRQVVQLRRRLALAAEIARPLAARGDDLSASRQALSRA